MNGSSELTCADQFERRAALRARAQNIERGVGVAAQAVARDAVDDALRHKLGDDVKPARQQIGRGMGIVRGNIMLLRERHVQPPSGQKKELDHPDIGRKRVGAQRVGIGQIRIAAEQAVDHRFNKTPLQQVRRLRLFQRQRGKEGQIDRRSAVARAKSALTMWLALPSPSGSPTTRLVPTSRMISSAIASGSENIFGID